jgi:COP9 signalosome complex subunit 7
MLSIVDFSQKSKVLQYQDLAKALDIPAGNVRELEDLIIDCIYNELVEGKLDQLNQRFHVVRVVGRDMRPSDIELAVQKLEEWDRQLQESQNFMENRILKQCDQAIKDNLERQLKEQEEINERRDQVLKDMLSQGSADKKKSSQSAFLQSFIPGFLNR